jgi:putative cell wall-binding protein
MRVFRRIGPTLVSLVVLGVLPFAPAAHAVGPYTGVWLDGEPGAGVLESGYESTSVDNTASSAGGVTFTSGSYAFVFRAPSGQSLVGGTYEDARGACGTTDPCLEVRPAAGTVCSGASGRFVVDESTFDITGQVLTFAVRFEQHCGTSDRALFGALYFNALTDRRARTLSAQQHTFTRYDDQTVSTAFTIGNTGVADLHPTAFTVTPNQGFTIAANTCPATLAAGASCTVTVSFTPPGDGDFAARLSFVDELAPAGPANGPKTVGSGRDIFLSASVTLDLGTFRIAGPDRIDTSIAASQDAFDEQGANVVVLTRKDGYADALAGAPLAVAAGGPLLLNPTGFLDGRVADEIERVLPLGSTVVLLGGPAALDPDIEFDLRALGYSIYRVAGTDRYDTAARIAEIIADNGPPPTIFVTTGLNYADALSASAAAHAAGAVVLLTNGNAPTAATNAYLAAHPATMWCIGGPACAAYPTAQHLVGATRFDTSRLVADQFFPDPRAVGIAYGYGYPDGLSAASNLGGAGPLLLTDTTTIPGATADYLTQHRLSIVYAAVFGGSHVIADAVLSQVDERIQAT